jgi:hypothetical protein
MADALQELNQYMAEQDRNDVSNRRADISQQRADTYGRFMDARIDNIPKETAIRQQRVNNESALLPYRIANLKARAKNGGPLSAYQQMRILMQGGPVDRQLPDGSTGNWEMPTQMGRTKLQTVLDAYPQMVPLLSQVSKGAQSYISAGGSIDKYAAATAAVLSGTATPSQEKILEKAGVSSNAVTEMAETMSRILQVGKTDSAFKAMVDLVKPHQGETLNSFNTRLKGVNKDMEGRYNQAVYETLWGHAQGGAAPAHFKDFMDHMNAQGGTVWGRLDDNGDIKFPDHPYNAPVPDRMAINETVSASPGGGSPLSPSSGADSSSSDGSITGKSGKKYTSEEVDAIASKYGQSRQFTEQVLKEKG